MMIYVLVNVLPNSFFSCANIQTYLKIGCFWLFLNQLKGLDAMILVFCMLSFKPTFSFSSFTFIKRLLSSSLSAIRVVSSVYLRLLIFLPAILIPACDSSILAFHMMYCTYKLNKQGDNKQPQCTPSPMHESEKWKWSRSVVSDSATPWTAAYQAPPSMGFSGQEYWSGVPLPSPSNNTTKFLFIYSNSLKQKASCICEF